MKEKTTLETKHMIIIMTVVALVVISGIVIGGSPYSEDSTGRKACLEYEISKLNKTNKIVPNPIHTVMLNCKEKNQPLVMK